MTTPDDENAAEIPEYRLTLTRTDRPERSVERVWPSSMFRGGTIEGFGHTVLDLGERLDEEIRASLRPCSAKLVHVHGEAICVEPGQHSDHAVMCPECWGYDPIRSPLPEDPDELRVLWTDADRGTTDVTGGRVWLTEGKEPPFGERLLLENPSGERIRWTGKRWHGLEDSPMAADAWGPYDYSPGPWRVMGEDRDGEPQDDRDPAP